MSNTTKKIAIGAIFAATAGYIAGVLTAPKSGKETRSDIKKAAKTTYAEAEKRLKKLHTELNSLIAEAIKIANESTGKAKENIEALIETAKKAKEKVRIVLSSTHEGDAEDKDLKEAIKDATSAVSHLESFLKK